MRIYELKIYFRGTCLVNSPYGLMHLGAEYRPGVPNEA